MAALAVALGVLGCGSGPEADVDAGEPDAGTTADAADLPCEGTAGTFSAQTIEVGGEDRYYHLYVPSQYDCAEPWPLLMDLHGSASGAVLPEEAYGLAAAQAAADREGFILLRPRSRFSTTPSGDFYRWDQNPGDPERNRVFLNALVEDLGSRYHLDAGRLYSMGFSSGTNQTSVLMADPESPFSGYGHIGGGAWTVSSLPSLQARVFMATGFRDYMRVYHQNLVDMLDEVSVPESDRWVRDFNGGHEIYTWMYDEMWPFLDAGERPDEGTLALGWSAEDAPTDGSLLAAAVVASGDVLAGGEDGAFVRRDAVTGEWSVVAISGEPKRKGGGFTGVCVMGSGDVGVAVGNGDIAVSLDAGATWAYRSLLPDPDAQLGYAHLNGIGCSDASATAAGYWTGKRTQNGQDWTQADLTYTYGRPQATSVSAAPWGTWLAVGYYDYLGRSEDGATFATIALPGYRAWLNDVAFAGDSTWVAVGDGGNILRSVDDGMTFQEVVAPSPARQGLYGVSFFDDATGLAVGRRCAAYLTSDGGATWSDVSCGLDAFLGDVAWLADDTAIAVGQGGLALRFDPAGR